MSTPNPPDHRPHTRRAPTQSMLYDRILPLLFIVLGLVMTTLIVIAAAVLLGLIQYR
ncbi:MAG: hypothetical protein HZB51_19660 [Chloroflexi bacterium]|nr:hypothetical protein [Chloroflexota bacterium]